MTVLCATLSTNNFFAGNPIAAQHRLRYRAISKRQDWDMPEINGMEYDQYDNPATTYFIWMDSDGEARGVARFCPTDRPFMVKDHFSTMISGAVPQGQNIVDGSRFCIDRDLPVAQRERITQELIIASLEFSLKTGIKHIVGIMHPLYWKNVFTNNGWQPDWISDISRTNDGKKARVALLPISQNILSKVRAATNIHNLVISYGTPYFEDINIAA